MSRIFVGMGSNLDRDRNIRLGLDELRNRFGPLLVSPVYESDAVGFTGPSFYNLVVGFESEETPAQIVSTLHDIESMSGRARQRKYVSRTLDLDLLLHGDKVIDDGDLQLPRSDILDYAFVLRPLAEIHGDGIHPVLNRSFAELWQGFGRGTVLRRVDLQPD